MNKKNGANLTAAPKALTIKERLSQLEAQLTSTLQSKEQHMQLVADAEGQRQRILGAIITLRELDSEQTPVARDAQTQ
jgi:hypothetical protein